MSTSSSCCCCFVTSTPSSSMDYTQIPKLTLAHTAQHQSMVWWETRPNTEYQYFDCVLHSPIQDGQVSSRMWRCGYGGVVRYTLLPALLLSSPTTARPLTYCLSHPLTSNQPRRCDAVTELQPWHCKLCWIERELRPWHCKLLCWIERELQRLENTIFGCRTKRGELPCDTR